MRFSIISALLPAISLVSAAPTPTPASAASTALQTFTLPASIVPSEVADLLSSSGSMLVTKQGGLAGLLSATEVLFGQFDTEDGSSSVDSSYSVPFSLLPPQLVTALLADVQLLISEGPTDVIQIVTGALTFTPSVSKREVHESKRQAPLSGPIGNFLAQLIGALPIDALPSI